MFGNATVRDERASGSAARRSPSSARLIGRFGANVEKDVTSSGRFEAAVMSRGHDYASRAAARLAPSWVGRAESGAEALWGRDTMTVLPNGSHPAGGSLAVDLHYGMAVGGRFVGTPRIGFSTSGTGRHYRFGYSLGLLGGEGLAFELGLDAQRREQANLNGTDHALVARFTARW